MLIFFCFLFFLGLSVLGAELHPLTAPAAEKKAVETKSEVPGVFTIHKPLENIGGIINTKSDEFAPALAWDASFMIFNSKRKNAYQDLYISHFDFESEKWSTPVFLSELNSPYNDETPTLSKNGRLLIFSSDRDGSLEMPKDSRGRVKVSFDLYSSEKTKSGWSTPSRLPGQVNTIHHERAPSLSSDGKYLYYTMWKFGDMSRTVVMRAELQNGIFVKLGSMPSSINAGYRELALIEAENRSGFYFSSTRPGGLGGWDIYYIPCKDKECKEKNSFGEAVNLGNKINSEANDVFLSRVDQLFFISSNRITGKGRFDIYSTFIFDKQDRFETRAIHFDFNSSSIKKVSYAYLNALAHFLKENMEAKLEVIGHTDMHGSNEFNLTLSQKRAKAVKRYLESRGIPSHSLTTKGLGESQPLIKKTGPEFDSQNRRTEFRLFK